MPQEPIFQTNNVALAATLATCGVPFDQDPQTRQPLPFVNIYDRAILEKRGYKGSGLSVEHAARHAWTNGIPGTIVYCLQKTGPFEEVVKAFDRHGDAIANADEAAGAVGMQNLTVLPVDPAIAAVICCQFAKNRRALLDGWKTAVPWIHLPGPVRTESSGGATYRVRSMKLYRLGASDATKAKIGA